MIVSHRRNLPLTALVSSFVQYGPDDHSKYTILANGVHIDSFILIHLLSAGGDWCLGGCCTVIATLAPYWILCLLRISLSRKMEPWRGIFLIISQPPYPQQMFEILCAVPTQAK